MQFGMGRELLHKKICNDLRNKLYPFDQSNKLYDLHKDMFSVYWDYNAETIQSYKNQQPLKTRDGWYLYCDNPNPRSVGNYPVQGGGGAILRKAVQYCQLVGLDIIAPLHDALYFLHKIEDTECVVLAAKTAMVNAFRCFYNRDIRVDVKTWKHGEYNIENKGRKYFNLLYKYFMSEGEIEDYELSLVIKELMK